MELTKEEKRLISDILKIHLEEVTKREKEPGQLPKEIAGEVKYEEFVQGIIEKMG